MFIYLLVIGFAEFDEFVKGMWVEVFEEVLGLVRWEFEAAEGAVAAIGDLLLHGPVRFRAWVSRYEGVTRKIQRIWWGVGYGDVCGRRNKER